MTAVCGYPLAMSEDEVRRLRIQADLFRDDARHMLQRIGVAPGWRCLDLCCGIGGITDLLSGLIGPTGHCTGIDIDAAKLDIARDWARSFADDNCEFVTGDGFATGLASASFDLVHTRFALGIVAGGCGMLDEALRLLRPGGWLFVEEIDIGGYCCHPPLAAFDEGLQLMVSCFDRLGADVRLGTKLNALLLANGVRHIRLRGARHALRAGQPMHYHLPLTLHAMRDAIVAGGAMTPPALQQLITSLTAHLDDPSTTTLPYTLVQAAGIVVAD